MKIEFSWGIKNIVKRGESRRFCSLGQLRKAATCFSFIIVFGLLCELIYLKQEACNELDSLHQLRLLCSQYHNKEIIGNMCSTLCDRSIFRLNRCHGNKRGKKVIIMDCDGCIEPEKSSSLVLKVEYDMGRWHTILSKNLMRARTFSEKLYHAMEGIRQYTREYYDTDLSEKGDLISFILGEDFNKTIERLAIPNATDVVLRNAVALGSQEEFLSFRILGAKFFLPKLYGTCGPAYFVENTPSFSSLNYIYFTAKKPDILAMKMYSPPWNLRAKAALSILKMVEDIEDNYDSALQICDIQPHNFGVSESGEAVMLDSDSLKFGQVLYYRSCTTDMECHFITCKGKCNHDTKWCEKEMVSNNLQTICARLYLSDHEIFGLLRGAPPSIQERLREVLYRCRDPKEKIFKLPRENKSDRTIVKELEILLKSTL